MSHERLGYLVLGIVLAAAAIYFVLAFHDVEQRKAALNDPTGTEVEGEAQLPSPVDLDDILSQLPSVEQNSFDPETTDWVGYSDGQDHFFVQRPRGWEVDESSLLGQPEYRRIVLSEGMAAFAVFPKGEFDVGLPLSVSSITKLSISGEPATMNEWTLPDGSWLAVVTLDVQPKNGFRIELSTLNSNPTARAILKEMIHRFQFVGLD
jgi:hypothetical protein